MAAAEAGWYNARVTGHTRALLFVIFAATSLALVAAFATLGSAANPSTASGYIARTGADYTGAVQISASTSDRTEETTATSSAPSLAFAQGRITTSSHAQRGRLKSATSTTLTAVSMLDGLITADEITLSANATASYTAVSASIAGNKIINLAVNGQAVAGTAGSLEVDGVGTLAILQSSHEASGRSGSAQILGLQLTLSEAWNDLPAGTVLVAGSASAQATMSTLEAFFPPPSASPSPSPSPSATDTGDEVQPPTDDTDYLPMPVPSPAGADMPSLLNAVFPVQSPYTYTHDWLAPRVGHLHQGCDIFASWGTPVVAVENGTVTNMSNYGLGGISLHVTAANGDYFYYAHLSGYAEGLRDGDSVLAGQVIGFVGNTGNAASTPSHLHFEIHPAGGAAIDPFPYLELWRSASAAAAQSEADAIAAATEGQPVVWLEAPPAPAAPPAPLVTTSVPVTVFAEPEFAPVESPFPDESDVTSNAPLVVLCALGTLAARRMTMGGVL